MLICTIREDIAKRRENGEKYESIALSYSVNRAMIKYIETHPNYRPSAKISRLMGIDPAPSLNYTRKRRDALNAIARTWGYKSWCDYETNLLRTERKECRE